MGIARDATRNAAGVNAPLALDQKGYGIAAVVAKLLLQKLAAVVATLLSQKLAAAVKPPCTEHRKTCAVARPTLLPALTPILQKILINEPEPSAKREHRITPRNSETGD